MDWFKEKMKSKIWERYKGKKVYIILKSKRVYSGEIKFLDNLDNRNYVGIKDSKGRLITFPEDQIKLIQEEG